MKYIVKWSESGTSKWGEKICNNVDEVREYLALEGYGDDIIDEALESGTYFSTFDVVNIEPVKTKPAYIILQLGILRPMLRPPKDVAVIFECRSIGLAEKILTKTAKRVGKGKYTYPVQYHLGTGTPKNYWLNRWISDVLTFTDPSLSLGDIKLLRARQ